MKKINLLFILLGVFAVSFLSSCDSTEEPGEEIPRIVLSPAGDQSAVEGTLVSIELTLTENLSSKSVLKTFEVDADGSANDTMISYPNNTSTAVYSFSILAPTAGQVNEVTFTLTDKAGEIATETISITGTSGTAPAGTITTYSATMIGGQTNATLGSAFSTSNGTVYLKAAAASSSNLIDFVYYFGATNMATIAAPNDPTVDGTGASSVDLTDTYTTKNATKFMTTSITPTAFTAMTDDADFPTFTGVLTKSNQLSIGTVFAFETVGGKTGLIHVSALSSSASGTITIDVKVQD